MASLQDRLRQQIKERKAKKVKSDLNNEVMKAEKQNKKNAGLRVYGKINKTTEKKLKKKGLTDAEIKKLKKKDVDNKGSFGAKAKNKRTYFRDDKSTASKSKSTASKSKSTASKSKSKSGPRMTSMKAPSTGPKPRNKDPKVNLKKRGPSRPSMTGFKKGGRIDGCAIKGHTKAKRAR